MNKEELIADVETQLLGIGNAVSNNELIRVGKRLAFSPSPVAVRFAKSIAATAVRRAMTPNVLTRDQKIFAMKAGELPQQAIKDLANNSMHLVAGERYIAKQITSPSGVDEMLRNSPQEKIGETNFDEGRMPINSNMLVTGVVLELANGAGANVDAVQYENQFDTGGLPSSFGNGEIQITAGNKTIMPSIPMAGFFAVGGIATVDSRGRRVVKLPAPKMILSGAKVEVTVRKPDNGALFAANNTFLKVTLLGPETSNK